MKIKLIRFKEDVHVPTRAHYDDAGMDCYAPTSVVLPPFNSQGNRATAVSIPLGFGLYVPNGYMASIRTRSSLNKKGILCQVGTIDAGYHGEISVILYNLTPESYHIKKDDRICQIVIEPVIYADFVDELGDERNAGGFGSTGK